jgi:hypothetical protein
MVSRAKIFDHGSKFSFRGAFFHTILSFKAQLQTINNFYKTISDKNFRTHSYFLERLKLVLVRINATHIQRHILVGVGQQY